MQEREKENKCKLTELERILESLEREVGKLEKENTDLKKEAHADSQAPKVCPTVLLFHSASTIVGVAL